MTTFKHLQKWTYPNSYFGATWYDYYSFIGQHRDSDTLTRSNFIEGLKALGGESETVMVVREKHCLVGWVEWIAIHESDAKSLNLADNMLEELEDYPILNEDAFSNLEYEEYHEAWENYAKEDFTKALKEKFSLSHRLTEYLLKHDYLQTYYETLIPSGEFYTSDNSGLYINVDYAVMGADMENLVNFIKNHRKQNLTS